MIRATNKFSVFRRPVHPQICLQSKIRTCPIHYLQVLRSTLILQRIDRNFKRPKDREDASDFDHFQTKSITSTQTKIRKICERTKRTKSFRNFLENFRKVFLFFFQISGNPITRVRKTRVRPRQAKARPGVRPDFRPDVRPGVRPDVRRGVRPGVRPNVRRTPGRTCGRTRPAERPCQADARPGEDEL